MSETPPLSPASTIRTLLQQQASLNYPTSPKSSTAPTKNGSIKRRLTTARLLSLPRKPPYSVKTSATLDAVITSGITGPARIMAEMRLRGYHVEKDVVLRAVKKWQTRAKTVERLKNQGLVAGKRLAGKSLLRQEHPADHPDNGEGQLTRLLPSASSERPTLEGDDVDGAGVPQSSSTPAQLEIGDNLLDDSSLEEDVIYVS